MVQGSNPVAFFSHMSSFNTLLRRLFFPKLTFLWGKKYTQELNKCMVLCGTSDVVIASWEKARKEGWEMLGCCSFKWNGQLYVGEEVHQVSSWRRICGFYSYEKEIEHMNLSSLSVFQLRLMMVKIFCLAIFKIYRYLHHKKIYELVKERRMLFLKEEG